LAGGRNGDILPLFSAQWGILPPDPNWFRERQIG
jgi:hypothetical protein